jgi:hypothetical protein
MPATKPAAVKPVFNKIKLKFLKELAELSDAPRPTVRTIRETSTSISYTCLVNDSNSYSAENHLKSLGFIPTPVKSTGGSMRGDFSSDAYGINYTHPNGVQVSCSAWFGCEKPTFTISIVGTPEQIEALTAK